MKFTFEFKATYTKTIEIEAEDRDHAFELAEEMYCDGEPELNSSEYVSGGYELLK